MAAEAWEFLAVRAQRGDRAAAGELFGRLRSVLLKLARTVRAPGHEREDLAQMGLLRVWERLPRYTPPRPFGAWVKVVARRAMLSAARRRAPLPALEFDVAEPEDGSRFGDHLPEWWVYDVMAGLDRPSRQAVSVRYGLGGVPVTQDVLAAGEGTSRHRVCNRVSESLACMRVAFEVQYGGQPA